MGACVTCNDQNLRGVPGSPCTCNIGTCNVGTSHYDRRESLANAADMMYTLFDQQGSAWENNVSKVGPWSNGLNELGEVPHDDPPSYHERELGKQLSPNKSLTMSTSPDLLQDTHDTDSQHSSQAG